MDQGNEDNKDENAIDDYNDIFDVDVEDDFDEEDIDLDGLDGIEDDSQEEKEEGNQNDDDQKEEEEEENDNFLDNDQDQEEDNEFTEKDLEVFNKKLNTNFKSTEELSAYMNKQEQESSQKKEDLELEKANTAIEYYSPILKLDDESLMRKQLETIALQNKKDLNDEDVKIEIEEELQALKDSHVLDIKADALRNKLKNLNQSALDSKNKIEDKRAAAVEAEKQTNKEKLQNAFLDIHKSESFFGIDLDKQSISDAYKDVSSGKFMERLNSDKKAQAELALLYKHREEIYKKASGLTYGDGMKAVLDEFKSKKESKNVSRAQRSGGSGGSEKSMKGLINDILFEKPVEEEK